MRNGLTVVIRSYKSYSTLPAAIRSVSAGIENMPDACILGVVPIEDTKTTKIFKEHDCQVVHTAIPDITRQANAGFLAADTKYVQVFDSDDIMYPNMSMSLYHSAERSGSDVVWSDYEMWSKDGFIQPVFCVGGLHELNYRCFVPELCLFRKEPWVRLGGFDEDLWRYAQWDYFLRLRNTNGRFTRIPFFGFRYMQSESQISRRIERGEYEQIDDPSWDKFRAKHPGMERAVTVGHGGRMRKMADVPS